MKLDRNVNENRRGKYALLRLRKLDEFTDPTDPFQVVDKRIAAALKTLEDAGILDWGATADAEFFVIRLKDKYAQEALSAYATIAEHDGEWEFGADVREMAGRAGPASRWCQKPD